MSVPRLRIFAGPNGSGKSTLNQSLNQNLLGVYINPDEIEKEIVKNDYLDLTPFKITTTKEVLLSFFKSHSLIEKANLELEVNDLNYFDNKIDFHNIDVNSYFASVCADFIRQRLLELKISFTFETVMSSPDKIELLKKAQNLGYRTYLYFIATKDPIINISRVENRVKMGGHKVPKEKIINRYYRSLELLSNAVKYSSRAYLFDNSSYDKVWIAEITNGKELELKSEYIPTWLNTYLLEK